MDADELVRAIRAALDETERIATWAMRGPWRLHYIPGDDAWQLNGRSDPYGILRLRNDGVNEGTVRHIAHNDPAAALRRVKADREIVERCEQYARWAANDEAPGFQALRAAGEYMLRALARGLGINPDTEEMT